MHIGKKLNKVTVYKEYRGQSKLLSVFSIGSECSW